MHTLLCARINSRHPDSLAQGVEVLVRFQTLDWGQGKFVMQLTAVRLLLADSVSNGKMRLRIQA